VRETGVEAQRSGERVSDGMMKAKAALTSKGGLIAAVVVVGCVGIGIGRWSSGGSSPATQAPPGVTTSTSASAPGMGWPAGSPSSPMGEAEPPQVFDTVEDPNWKAGVPMRDMDRDIFAKFKDPALERSALLDMFPDRPYKVRVMGSASEHRFGLVMIDLNRDGKWDERWDLRAGQVTRAVEHDEGASGQRVTYTLTHGKWQPH
jgi:hypothetical protein